LNGLAVVGGSTLICFAVALQNSSSARRSRAQQLLGLVVVT
jgi:hypothetical protein